MTQLAAIQVGHCGNAAEPTPIGDVSPSADTGGR